MNGLIERLENKRTKLIKLQHKRSTPEWKARQLEVKIRKIDRRLGKCVIWNSKRLGTYQKSI